LIHAIIESAKPRVVRVLGTSVGDIFRDPMQQMDALDRDMKKDVQAVRQTLMNLRTELRNLMSEETRQLVNLGRLAYADSLERLALGMRVVVRRCERVIGMNIGLKKGPDVGVQMWL
jgi:hypothetical protein